MRPGADAGGCHAELARIALRIGDELGDRLRRNRRIDLEYVWRTDDSRDRRNVAKEVEIEFLVKRRIDRRWRRGEQQGVAVRGCTHDRFGADIGGRAGTVLDHELLAEALR